jgi:hypothetical protein
LLVSATALAEEYRKGTAISRSLESFSQVVKDEEHSGQF